MLGRMLARTAVCPVVLVVHLSVPAQAQDLRGERWLQFGPCKWRRSFYSGTLVVGVKRAF